MSRSTPELLGEPICPFSQVIKKYLPAVGSRAGDLLTALDENHVAEGTVDSIEQVVRERRESPVREPEW